VKIKTNIPDDKSIISSRYFMTKLYGNDKREINESIAKMLVEKNIDYKNDPE